VTTLGDTQAIARVTDAGHDRLVAPAVSLAPARRSIAPVTMLPAAPVTVAFPAQLVAPLFPATEQLRVVQQTDTSQDEPAVEPADTAETTADESAGADDEMDESAGAVDQEEAGLPSDADLTDADLTDAALTDVEDGVEVEELVTAPDLAEDLGADDELTAGDAEVPAPAAPPRSHEVIYAEAMASIAALAQNWSDAVEGLFDTPAHQAAA
jgi:hypothetical protein